MQIHHSRSLFYNGINFAEGAIIGIDKIDNWKRLQFWLPLRNYMVFYV
jgi:hypothetical protein